MLVPSIMSSNYGDGLLVKLRWSELFPRKQMTLSVAAETASMLLVPHTEFNKWLDNTCSQLSQRWGVLPHEDSRGVQRMPYYMREVWLLHRAGLLMTERRKTSWDISSWHEISLLPGVCIIKSARDCQDPRQWHLQHAGHLLDWCPHPIQSLAKLLSVTLTSPERPGQEELACLLYES